MDDKKGTLLIVDDEISILSALKRTFNVAGYMTMTANSAAEGLEILNHFPIDIIISDMRMPEMDGAEFLKIAAQQWPDYKRILLTGYADVESAISAVNHGRIDYYISKPWDRDNIINIVNTVLTTKRLKEQNETLQKIIIQRNEELERLNSVLEEKVQERTLELHYSLIELRKTHDKLRQTHDAAIEIFLSLQELHEGAVKGYCRSVASKTELLAKALGLSDQEVHSLYLTAMLHNLGKWGLPPQISTKPFNKLTVKEHQEFIQYPLIGSTILSAFPSLKDVANIILHHRERYDGSGYPDRLRGESISLGARILSIVVDYHELQYGLLDVGKYHAKLTLKFLQEHKLRYDPKILTVFMDLIQQQAEQEDILGENVLTANELKPGMILSRQLMSANGLILLSKGYVLNPEVIEKLKLLNNLMVYVYEPNH